MITSRERKKKEEEKASVSLMLRIKWSLREPVSN